MIFNKCSEVRNVAVLLTRKTNTKAALRYHLTTITKLFAQKKKKKKFKWQTGGHFGFFSVKFLR